MTGVAMDLDAWLAVHHSPKWKCKITVSRPSKFKMLASERKDLYRRFEVVEEIVGNDRRVVCVDGIRFDSAETFMMAKHDPYWMPKAMTKPTVTLSRLSSAQVRKETSRVAAYVATHRRAA